MRLQDNIISHLQMFLLFFPSLYYLGIVKSITANGCLYSKGAAYGA
jgi:hypothetical protein